MISKNEGLLLYHKLLLARLSEEKIRELYPANEIKTPVHLGIGGEAIPVGVCHALPEGSEYFGTYRNHTLFLTLSENTDGFFGELYGKMNGVGKGKAGSMHLTAPEHGLIATSAVVATTIPLAVGAAFAAKYKNEDKWVAVFFGDGAMEEGVFWESLNFASLHRLRVLFICEDNSLAIHTHSKDRRGFRSVEEVGKAFNCHSLGGTGTKLSEVIAMTRRAIELMKTEPGPAVLHFDYHRFLEHVGPSEDYAAGYRTKPSEKDLRLADPLIGFRTEILANGANAAELEKIEKEVIAKINTSVLAAQKAPFPPAEELYTDVLV